MHDGCVHVAMTKSILSNLCCYHRWPDVSSHLYSYRQANVTAGQTTDLLASHLG